MFDAARGARDLLGHPVLRAGAPHHPEYGVGALAEGGVCIVNEQSVRSVGATREQMAEVLRSEWDELERRCAHGRGGSNGRVEATGACATHVRQGQRIKGWSFTGQGALRRHAYFVLVSVATILRQEREMEWNLPKRLACVIW